MQRLVAGAPRHHLPHAFHFAPAREVQQNSEGSKQLQPLGERTEHGQRNRDVLFRANIELLHIVVLILHFFVLHEGRIFGLRHPDRIKQMAVGRDVNRLHVRKRRKHHLHFGGFKHLAVIFHVTVIHFDIRLREEAENLRQQILLRWREILFPVAHIVGQRNFFGQPMDALLHVPRLIRPWVGKGFVDRFCVE